MANTLTTQKSKNRATKSTPPPPRPDKLTVAGNAHKRNGAARRRLLATGPSIEQVLRELVKDVPESEWAKLPRDLSRNHDHYIYGAPKK